MFHIAHAAMQHDPDESADPMRNGPDGLIVSQAGVPIGDIGPEDASFDLDRSVGTLIENASHLTVALGRAMALGHSRAFFVPRTCADPRGKVLFGRKGGCRRTDFGNNLLRRIHSQARHLSRALRSILMLREQSRHLLVELTDMGAR